MATNFAAAVRWHRNQRGWGLTELARRAGVSRGLLHQIEGGRVHWPQAVTVYRLADALGVAPISLLRGHGAANFDARENGSLSLRITDARRVELLERFRDVLDSPLGAGLADLIEGAHRLLPVDG